MTSRRTRLRVHKALLCGSIWLQTPVYTTGRDVTGCSLPARVDRGRAPHRLPERRGTEGGNALGSRHAKAGSAGNHRGHGRAGGACRRATTSGPCARQSTASDETQRRRRESHVHLHGGPCRLPDGEARASGRRWGPDAFNVVPCPSPLGYHRRLARVQAMSIHWPSPLRLRCTSDARTAMAMNSLDTDDLDSNCRDVARGASPR